MGEGVPPLTSMPTWEGQRSTLPSPSIHPNGATARGGLYLLVQTNNQILLLKAEVQIQYFGDIHNPILHDHFYYHVCPGILSLVRDPLRDTGVVHQITHTFSYFFLFIC
jgi:hypothetical protein